MEDELAIGKYLAALARYWWFVALVLGVSLVVGVATALPGKPLYAAKAGVAVIRSVTEVTFEPKIKTKPEEGLSGAAASAAAAARLQTLAQLVANSVVEAKVLSKLGSVLPPEQQRPGSLLGMVKGEAPASGELITIQVVSEDPQRAALIANAWGQAYEEYVNQLYGGVRTEASLKGPLEEALQAYREAEDDLARFQGNNRVALLNLLVSDRQEAFKIFQEGRLVAARDVMSRTAAIQAQSSSEFATALAANRLLTFKAEQEAKRQLLSSYLEAISKARREVFNKQAEASLQTLSDYYGQKAKMDRLLGDARAFLAQVREGGSSNSATALLPLLLLKAQAFATSVPPPSGLQVTLDGAASSALSRAQVGEELTGLIKVLEARQKELEGAIAAKSTQLVSDSGYKLPPLTPSEGGTLLQAIKEAYPDLFQLGDLARLSDLKVEDTPLAQEAAAAMERTLQAQRQAVGTDLASQPVFQDLTKTMEELQKWQEELERQSATSRELQTTRDLAWEAYTALTRKSTEVDIAAQAGNTLVRFALPAVEPRSPLPDNRFRNLPQAFALGLLVGVVGAFALDYLSRARRRS